MKESSRLAGNVIINQLQSSMFLNTEGYHIKKQTNILAGIEDIGQLQRKVLLDTKGQYIKESYEYKRQGPAPQHGLGPLVPVFPALCAGWVPVRPKPKPWPRWVFCLESQSGRCCRARPPSLTDVKMHG